MSNCVVILFPVVFSLLVCFSMFFSFYSMDCGLKETWMMMMMMMKSTYGVLRTAYSYRSVFHYPTLRHGLCITDFGRSKSAC